MRLADGNGHDQAFATTADGAHHQLTQRSPTRLSQSLVTNFLMRGTERFLPLSRQTSLIQALDEPDEHGNSHGHVGGDSGLLSLCHVAAGFIEAVIEFAKGFAIWDLAPGHDILNAVGGTCIGSHWQASSPGLSPRLPGGHRRCYEPSPNVRRSSQR
ncbi:inositol monophosphatase family protein [Rugosimonospora africana]|uniref:inositol monophosphatase family protein n=1 Tax=Rugosimonospora africana TaxID=556532 RepID=UPI001943076A|nr:inositol monophosphatase family protein [Rugosimonospora africana]